MPGQWILPLAHSCISWLSQGLFQAGLGGFSSCRPLPRQFLLFWTVLRVLLMVGFGSLFVGVCCVVQRRVACGWGGCRVVCLADDINSLLYVLSHCGGGVKAWSAKCFFATKMLHFLQLENFDCAGMGKEEWEHFETWMQEAHDPAAREPSTDSVSVNILCVDVPVSTHSAFTELWCWDVDEWEERKRCHVKLRGWKTTWIFLAGMKIVTDCELSDFTKDLSGCFIFYPS